MSPSSYKNLLSSRNVFSFWKRPLLPMSCQVLLQHLRVVAWSHCCDWQYQAKKLQNCKELPKVQNKRWLPTCWDSRYLVANSSNIFHPVNMFILSLTGEESIFWSISQNGSQILWSLLEIYFAFLHTPPWLLMNILDKCLLGWFEHCWSCIDDLSESVSSLFPLIPWLSRLTLMSF